jgi:hypothetical protein
VRAQKLQTTTETTCATELIDRIALCNRENTMASAHTLLSKKKKKKPFPAHFVSGIHRIFNNNLEETQERF